MPGRRSLVCLLLAATVTTARAEAPDTLTPSYLVDGGAIPFLWAPLLGAAVIETYVEPREQPLLFDSREGGQTSRRDREIPAYAVALGGTAVVGALTLGDDPSRFYHAKGLAQSLATSTFIAVSAKRIFGRRRPDYAGTDDGRRSFPSGHTTCAVSVLTYSALYLRHHGFDQWRDPDSLPWWEVGAYAGLGGLAVGFAGERVYHHRHHVTDVIAGALLGGGSSAAFFMYQEARYRSAMRGVMRIDAPIEPIDQDVFPAVDGPTVSFGGSF